MREITELAQVYKSDFYDYIGVADSGLGFFLPWIMDNIQPRTVIIERDPQQVTDSLCELGMMRTNHAFLLTDKLKPFLNHPLVLRVPYEALGSKRTIQKLFWHLMPGVAFDEDRYEMLSKMYVLPAPEVVVRNQAASGQSLLRTILPQINVLENQHAGKFH